MNTLIGILIPLLGTTLGAACVFFIKKELNQLVSKCLLGFASGVMIAASVWSLIIPAIDMSSNMNKLAFLPAAIGVLLADTAVKAANVDVVGVSTPGNGGTSFSNEVILTFSGDSGAVRQAIIAAREVGLKVLKTLDGTEPTSTTVPYI